MRIAGRARLFLAVGITFAAAVLFVCAVVLGTARPEWVQTHASVDVVADSLLGAAWLVFVVVGALLAVRVPGSGVALAFVGAGLLQLLNQASMEYALFALHWAPRAPPLGETAAWLSLNAGVLGVACMPFVMLLFPTGAAPSPRWRWVRWISTLGVALLLAQTVASWPYRDAAMAVGEVPSAFDDSFWSLLGLIGILTVSGALLAAAASMLVRFARSRGPERQQLKWFAASASAVAAVVVADATLLGSTSPLLVDVLVALTFAGVPVAVAVAILRYRLYEIDRIISRTISYAVLSGLLGLLYLFGVVVLQLLLRPVTGESQVAVAGATLGVAAAFGPARRRVQRGVDRRFNRARYDARVAVERYATRLREAVDLDQVADDLIAAVGTTVQPANTTVWLSQRPTAASGRRRQ